MADLALIIFLLTYTGVAIGRVPGLAMDRTGIALLGAIALVVCGVVPLEKAEAAVDLPTILLLYSLMVISAQLRLGGFYSQIAAKITAMLTRPRLFLWVTMLTSATLSALLANDIICLAFTPVLSVALITARINPIPFLLGLAIASNIGSAATIIGNPQNMLIGQVGKLHFSSFLSWCTPPVLMALIGSYLILCRIYRNDLNKEVSPPTSEEEVLPHPFDQWQSTKGLVAIVILMILFFTTIPRELSAISVAGLLLCSRKMTSRRLLGLVDWHLITLFCALFVVIDGIVAHHIPSRIIADLSSHGINLHSLPMLAIFSTIISNIVSNVPASILLVRTLEPGHPAQWYTLAVSSTFAGNLLPIGSIANLIVIEQARLLGVKISFREHARTGIPVTLLSILILIGWIYI